MGSGLLSPVAVVLVVSAVVVSVVIGSLMILDDLKTSFIRDTPVID